MSTMPTGEQVDVWFKEIVEKHFHTPTHSYSPESALSRMLNTARRNGTPHQPKHCACVSCVNGFTHIADVAI